MKKQLILVINCGSSSLKFSLIAPESGKTTLSGIAERLFSSQAGIKIEQQDKITREKLSSPYDHQSAISSLVSLLIQWQLIDNVFAVGHRVVHGGETYSEPTLITDNVKKTIMQLAKIAPLHNPVNLLGINAAQAVFNHIPHVAIFDTAFHHTMPKTSFIYGIPYALYQDHGIRRYGFHGTSHDYVSTQAALALNKPREDCNLISAHLGNGCSVVAIKAGKSIDTSMGFTPLEGVMMGTRSGDLDAGIIFHLVDKLGYSLKEVNELLNKKSGLLGVSGISNDCRELEQSITSDKNCRAKLALTIFSYRIAKSIASFSAAFEQLDGLIFTGGIGENSMLVRELVLSHLALLNFKIDLNKNEKMRFGQTGLISSTNSRHCWVIPTDEEYMIAQQTNELLQRLVKKEIKQGVNS
ncbi:MAG: acetate kinase [Alteromonadaceae bacterium]|jgi:acetate kinase